MLPAAVPFSSFRLPGPLRRGLNFVRTFARENKGATAVMFSVLTTVVMGSIAFGIDGATWYQTDRKLQTAADMAAMAAAADTALQNAAGYNGDTAETIAQGALTRSGVDISTLTVLEVNSPPSSGAYAGNGNAVEVIVSQDVPIFFAGLFVEQTPQAYARAVALTDFSGEVCVLALDDSLPSAVLFSGNSDVEIDCGIGTNSIDDQAILGQGSASVQATLVRSAGGIDDNINMNATLATYTNPISNPFSDLAVPAYSGCDVNARLNLGRSDTDPLDPGVYCKDVTLGSQSNITFNDGLFIFDGADLTINAQATAFGENVTFIFTNSVNPDAPGKLQINGSADVEFSAPTSGTFEDVLFMRDPDASNVAGRNSERWIINGSARTWMNGAIYVPGVELEITGNGDPSGGCFVIVAGVVTFSGNSNVYMNCATTDQELAGIITTRLVE